MNTQNIYIETTLFNYYFDINRDAHKDTMKLFKEILTGKYNAFTSTYVTDELEKAPEVKREKMLKLIPEYNIAVLAPRDEAVTLAEIYVSESVMLNAKMVNAEKDKEETAKFEDFIKNVKPEDFEKYFKQQ